LQLTEFFAAEMARLGPFGPAPKFAVAVSGGADSTALALLARQWAMQNGGSILALIADHGLRKDSGPEAILVRDRLEARRIESKIITLNLLGGARLQETARAARHAALAQAARAAGCLFLLFGHHAGDQAETVAMRAARGLSGLEGMAACTARADVLILRPLLAVPPEALRGFLRREKMQWVEDPSNADRKFERVRIRQDGGGMPPENADMRRATEQKTADFLARHVTIRPEGFAVIRADSVPPAALAALFRVIGGANYPPRRDSVAALGEKLRAATLGGVRVQKTAKFGGGWLLAREPSACARPVPAAENVFWDNRFRLQAGQPGATIGALGADAAAFRKGSDLPSLVLQTMPALRQGSKIILAAARFAPPAPVTSHPFFN
jgi:tRNA(Ile)-lysidine synthase